MAIVYQHRRLDIDQIFYIGIGKSTKRAFDKKSRGKTWRDYVKNHKYSIEILYDNVSWEEACKIEKRLIKEIGRRDLGLGPLVNLTDGGDGVPNLSEESRKKMASQKGNFGTLNSFYGKKHIGDLSRFGIQNRGKAPWIKGKKHSKESLQKMSKSQLGKTLSIETKKKLGDAIRGKRSGDKHPMFGKTSHNRKKLQHIESGLVFDYAGKAAEYFKVSPSTITKWIKESKFKILN